MILATSVEPLRMKKDELKRRLDRPRYQLILEWGGEIYRFQQIVKMNGGSG